MSDLEKRLLNAAEKGILQLIERGGWVVPDHTCRITIDPKFMADVWAQVDQGRLKKRITERIEAELADRVVQVRHDSGVYAGTTGQFFVVR